MKKIIFSVAFFALFLSGCGSVYQMNNELNQSINQMMGTYSAPLLGGAPRPSGCSDEKCRSLDALEARGYDLARQKKITWTRLVNSFYEGRAKLYPDSNDSSKVHEMISFQRMLAEQMDAGKITESEWAYLVEKKFSGATITCNTKNVGAYSTNYQTVCR